MLYDLHIHSCLSPCAEDDMTPATILGMAKLAGADLVAIADHNSALNLPAARLCAEAYGVRLLPAIEVNTEEEIHLLCYFPTVEAALEMGKKIYAALPSFPYDPRIWGRQLVVNEDDEQTGSVDKLLSGALAMNIYQVKSLCESLGGVAIPAHAEKDSYSLLSVMGFCPEDLDFAVYELKDPEKYPELVGRGLLMPDREILTSSDAHCIAAICGNMKELPENSIINTLLK